jgi:hypothetical protein
MGIMKHKNKTRSIRATRQAGELLAIEAVDRTGLIITGEGAFVRIFEVRPPNPLILSAEARARIADGYARLVAQLAAGQSVQFYVQATPIRLREVLKQAHRQVAYCAGEPPASAADAQDPLSLSRWRLFAAMEESLRLHVSESAAVQVGHYVVCPFVPSQQGARRLISQLRARSGRLPKAPLSREVKAHRRASRESLNHTEGLRSTIDALSLNTRLLNGEEAVNLLWSRFNPTVADAQREKITATEILGELDQPVELTEARAAARRLRELIAASPIDFSGSHHHVEVDRDIEQTIYAAGTADSTRLAWLMGAMLTREPFSMSVHVHALDRRGERRKLKMRYRRTFALNRGAEARGRVPDFDRYAQEEEGRNLLTELSGSNRVGLYDMSIYHTPRVRGPEADRAALAEAVDFCATQMHTASDVTINRGAFQQEQLWPSTLPLGRDTARRARRYVTRNVGDTVPLAGTKVGSPTGIPFAFSQPGRTLEFLNPFDRHHNNSTLLVCGESGSGKTVVTLKMIANILAYGARAAFVIDRSGIYTGTGHYETLTKLVPGARQVDIGSDDSPYAINPWDGPSDGMPSREKVSFLIALHAALMAPERLTALERAQLGSAIREVYSVAHEQRRPARESLLHEVLLARSKQEMDSGAVEVAAVLRSLADRLGEFCGQGAYSYLLDRETNVPHDSPLVVFDTRSCPEVLIAPVMFAIIEYVQQAIIRIRRETSTQHPEDTGDALFKDKVLLEIEECWRVLHHPDSGAYFNDLARRARHLGLMLKIISQLFSDFVSEHGTALLNNCKQMLILRSNAAEVACITKTLELSDEKAAIIGRLKTVKGSYAEIYWINGTRGEGPVTLPLGPKEYWCYTNEPTRDVPMRNAALARHDGRVWDAINELARDGDEGKP